MLLRLAVVAFLAALSATAIAAEYRADVISVYDGDTFTAKIAGNNERVRVLNIDTPEIAGKCATEKQAAVAARDFAKAWLGKSVIVTTVGSRTRDQYGRVLAQVTNDAGADLGEAMIAAGLARPWRGRRERWC